MADGTSKVEGQYIRGLEIDKVIKGIAEVEYSFKDDLEVSSTPGDSIRWYQETFGDLTATSPMRVANVAALTPFVTLEKDWTRNTSYTRKYGAEGFISDEDIRTADIDVLARSLWALVRAITKQTDTRILNIVTQNFADPGNTGISAAVNMVTSSGAWSVQATCDPIRDLLEAQKAIYVSGGYNASSPTVWLSPQDHVNLKNWIISTKGSSIPQFSSAQIEKGAVMQLLGMNIKVSPNVTADKAVMLIPKLCATWKTAQGLTSDVTTNPGIGKRIRVWEDGEAILTAPKAVCFISNTQ